MPVLVYARFRGLLDRSSYTYVVETKRPSKRWGYGRLTRRAGGCRMPPSVGGGRVLRKNPIR